MNYFLRIFYILSWNYIIVYVTPKPLRVVRDGLSHMEIVLIERELRAKDSAFEKLIS